MDNFHGDPMKQPFQSKEMMQNFRIALIVFILTATAFLALPAQEKAPPPAPVAKAVVFPIQGQLSKTMPMTLKRAVKQAKARGAETLIIEIDTPGGEIMLMEQLRDLVFEAYQKDGLETVAFINPNADSAGALVSMACRQVYMSPLAHIGSATPVQVSPIPIPEEYIPAGQEDMMNKVKSRARAIFRATAIETDRNPDIAEAMVDPDLELVLALIDGEEGIPDFRSPGGLWDRYDPNDFLYQKIISSEESRKKYWKMHSELYYTIIEAEPNPSHYALVDLDKIGKLDCLITQNIDNLHQKAGLDENKILELHGNMMKVACLSCGNLYSREEIQEWLENGIAAPTCEKCNGILKPTTIAFGQSMPVRETEEAEKRSRHCDLFIAIGSSLVVHPAAMMPLYAQEGGARLVIINLTPTPYDGQADLTISGKAGEVFSRIVAAVK